MDSPFVHLHVHSEYSLLDGAQQIPKMVKQAAAMGMPALALTDHGVMHGSLDFYDACKKNNVKPILGVEAYVAPGSYLDKTPRAGKNAFHLLLLAKNETGYKNLLKLTTIAAVEGFYRKPRIDKDVLAQHAEGLIGTSACLGSEVCQALMGDDYEKALELAGRYREIFGRENFFIELQDHNLPEQARIREPLLKIAKDLGLGVICSNDAHYLCRGDAEAHDVLLCIQTGKTVNDADRLTYKTQEFYLKTQEEMARLFGDLPHAMAMTHEIAERCNLDLEFGRLQLPAPEMPAGLTPHEYVTQLCEQALPRLYNSANDEVLQRLEYELKIIDQTKFSSYFLIVRDFAQFARDKGIFFGVRGSAAGSLVSYCLGITDIDPIDYALTFERFLNPERIAMPDIDMDFEDARREEVIRYVTEKYGQDRVAQIITFGTMAARAAIRDAGRALALPIPDVDRAAKCIPTVPVGTTIDKALEVVPEFKQIYDSGDEMRKLIDTARSIEGMARNTSIHAAGVVISADPLVEHVPLQRAANGEMVTQYPAGALEKIGLLKMDFLGLSNLSVLAKAVENVRRSRGETVDVRNIPLDDKKAYEMLARGDVIGVFQLEGEGMRRNLMDLKPQNVRELAAMVALYRPGPLAQIPRYIRNKFGLDPITYIHPSLEPILKETYGIIVYQDQVLRIVQAIAGFSLGKADILRKAMGKKKKEEMDRMRADFIQGAIENGVAEAKAKEIFDLIEPFAGYAFNKAHASCYAMVAYQTAYMKANYPAEYMAALMAVYRDKEDKITKSIDECRRLGIEVLAPDINRSDMDFTFEGGKVRFGICAIKGVGEAAVEGALKARSEGGPFSSIFDFCERARENGSLTRATVECLVKAGAFDSLHPNRKAMVEGIEAAISHAERAARDKAAGQNSLFEGGDSKQAVKHTPPLPNVPDYTRSEKLAFEKEVLGVYVSDHPLKSVTGRLMAKTSATASQLSEMKDGEAVVVGGIITNIRQMLTKKSNEKMAVVTLEDMTGIVSVTLFPRVYAQFGDLLAKDAIVTVKGKVSFRERVNNDETARQAELRADGVELLGEGSEDEYDDSVGTMMISLQRATRQQLDKAREIISSHPGEHKVFIDVRINGHTKRLQLPTRVRASEELGKQIEMLLDPRQGNKVQVRTVEAFRKHEPSFEPDVPMVEEEVLA